VPNCSSWPSLVLPKGHAITPALLLPNRTEDDRSNLLDGKGSCKTERGAWRWEEQVVKEEPFGDNVKLDRALVVVLD
jgi:hypothetical protein